MSAPAIQRPVLAGWHPDPSVCRAGDAYYLATSTFEYLPAIPIYRSTDLRDWDLVGHVLDDATLRTAPASGGLYAPTLRYHAGRFWLVTTNVSDGGGHLLVHACDPEGPWSPPVRFPALAGIDPDLAWDAAGTCFLTYSSYHDGRAEGIAQAVIDPESGRVRGAPRLVWAGSGGQYPEAPHLYRIGEHWYLLIAEGGTERGHMATIARGPTPSGPFTAFAGNPILTARSTCAPVQSTGHGDLVERPDGSWAVVYLGTRPRGGNAGFAGLGREVFARDVAWVDGWPEVGAAIEPTRPPRIATDDGVPGAHVAPVWLSPRHPPREAIRIGAGGWQLAARAPDPSSPELAFLGRRQQHTSMRVTAELVVDAGAGGLSLRIDPLHHYDLDVEGTRVRAIAWIGGLRCVLAEHALAAPERLADLRLQLATECAAPTPQQLWFGPDTVVLSIVDRDGARELARVDGRYLTPEVAGGFTGRVVGIYARAGRATLRRWRYVGWDDALSVAPP